MCSGCAVAAPFTITVIRIAYRTSNLGRGLVPTSMASKRPWATWSRRPSHSEGGQSSTGREWSVRLTVNDNLGCHETTVEPTGTGSLLLASTRRQS
jgi:hypothetical protein